MNQSIFVLDVFCFGTVEAPSVRFGLVFVCLVFVLSLIPFQFSM